MRPVLVIGTGPAGLLSALRLAAHGFTVDAVDPRPTGSVTTRPQWRHVHHLTPEATEQLQAWIPDITTTHERPLLDRLLWRACRSHLRHVFRERLRELRFDADRGHAYLAAHWRSYHCVIDASGAARASIASLAAAGSLSLPLEEGPPGHRYISFRLEGVDGRLPPGLLTERGGYSKPGAILRIRRRGQAWLTLQLPHNVPAPRTLREITETLAQLRDVRLGQAIRQARIRGQPYRFAARPSSLLRLQDCEPLPSAWLALGDSLLLTSPELGQGVDQLVKQVALLDRGLELGYGWRSIRESLAEQAETRWWQSLWTESLGGFMR